MSSTNPKSVAEELESFVRAQFQVSESDPLFVRTVNLWEEGFVDSTGLVEMIAFIEERFEIELPDELLFDPDFTSIDGIATCIVRLLHGEAA